MWISVCRKPLPGWEDERGKVPFWSLSERLNWLNTTPNSAHFLFFCCCCLVICTSEQRISARWLQTWLPTRTKKMIKYPQLFISVFPVLFWKLEAPSQENDSCCGSQIYFHNLEWNQPLQLHLCSNNLVKSALQINLTLERVFRLVTP